MAISFNEIFDLNIPFVQAELVRQKLSIGTIRQEYTALLIGQKTAEGTATANEVIEIFSASEAKAKFGKTSMLAHAAKRFYDNNKSVRLKVFPMADAVAGVKATGSVAFTGTATNNGTSAIYINGKLYAVAISTGDTATAIGDALVAKIAADTEAQVTASNALGTVTITAVHAGTYGNTIKIRINYNADDVTPGGVLVTTSAMTGGAGDPDLTTTGLVALIEENQFNLIAMPYVDNTNIGLIDTALTNNFKASEMLDGFCVVAVDDTVTNLIAKSLLINSSLITIADNGSVFSTGFEQAAATIGYIADVAQSNPGAGYLNGQLLGILPLSQRLSSERNVLAGNGIATVKHSGKNILLERTVTTLQLDDNGIALDIDDRDIRVFLTISYVRYTFVVWMSQFQNYKLGGDNDIYGQGVQVMTPNIYKQNLILNYQSLVDAAVCEDLEGFINSVVVERAGNRINSTMHVNIINVVLQQAMKIGYEV